MIQIAQGEQLPLSQDAVTLKGWAIESRIYAEDPFKGFLPSIGRISCYETPRVGAGDRDRIIRNDTGVYAGASIPIYYDPMIAKLCTWAPTREAAIEAMRDALDATRIDGPGHNIPFLSAIMDHPQFVAGDISTSFIGELYPDGFTSGHMPDDVQAAIASEIAEIYAEQRRRLTGANYGVANYVVSFSTGEIVQPQPGLGLAGAARLTQNGHRFDYAYREYVGTAIIRPHRAQALMHLMPEVQMGADLKKMLCPMPSVLKSLHVELGQEIEAGQMVAVIEAMKMENVLRAETSGRIKALPFKPGQNLVQDDLILELE